MSRAIDELNDAMVAAGVRVFVGGLRPVDDSRALRLEEDGRVRVECGPYLKSAEHVGGLWVLDAPDLDSAVEWGRKAAAACRAGVEVRPFHGG